MALNNLNEYEKEVINNFFTKLYYNNDILGLTGVNCFNYAAGEVDPVILIETLEAQEIEINLKFKF